MCTEAKKWIVMGVKNVKLLIDLVRGEKLHAKEKRDGKSENKEGATEEIQNKMVRKRQTRDRWKVKDW